MIKIGVSACFLYPDSTRKDYAKKSLTCLENYTGAYLAKKNVLPILIPDLSEDLLIPFLEQLDGFVLTGGNDISSKNYGEEPICNNKWPGDPHRDRYELKIIDYAFLNKKPLFGICRGHQLLNVYFKGTLYQDLKEQTKTEVIHRNDDIYDKNFHQVTLTKNEILSDLYKGITDCSVNSVHHQGVKDLGNDLQPMAYSHQDNLIEAFTHTEMKKHFVLGVQWHPEWSESLKGTVIDPFPLLDYFLSATKR